MPRARGYDPFHTSPENTALLDRVIEVAHRRGGVAIFDLDGCLFDTRPRQVRIFRELASAEGLAPLDRVTEAHFLDWSLGATMRRAGIPADWVEAHRAQVRKGWERRFFTSEYVQYDHAMPGAAALVRRVHEVGAHVVYLTGRDITMAAGTEHMLRRFGFPYNRERASLYLKPVVEMEDTAFKESALLRIETMGKVCLFLDNEPSIVNMYHRRDPEALVVFVETDHSPRPDEPAPGIPWLRGFLRHAGAAGATDVA